MQEGYCQRKTVFFFIYLNISIYTERGKSWWQTSEASLFLHNRVKKSQHITIYSWIIRWDVYAHSINIVNSEFSDLQTSIHFSWLNPLKERYVFAHLKLFQ